MQTIGQKIKKLKRILYLGIGFVVALVLFYWMSQERLGQTKKNEVSSPSKINEASLATVLENVDVRYFHKFLEGNSFPYWVFGIHGPNPAFYPFSLEGNFQKHWSDSLTNKVSGEAHRVLGHKNGYLYGFGSFSERKEPPPKNPDVFKVLKITKNGEWTLNLKKDLENSNEVGFVIESFLDLKNPATPFRDGFLLWDSSFFQRNLNSSKEGDFYFTYLWPDFHGSKIYFPKNLFIGNLRRLVELSSEEILVEGFFKIQVGRGLKLESKERNFVVFRVVDERLEIKNEETEKLHTLLNENFFGALKNQNGKNAAIDSDLVTTRLVGVLPKPGSTLDFFRVREVVRDYAYRGNLVARARGLAQQFVRIDLGRNKATVLASQFLNPGKFRSQKLEFFDQSKFTKENFCTDKDLFAFSSVFKAEKFPVVNFIVDEIGAKDWAALGGFYNGSAEPAGIFSSPMSYQKVDIEGSGYRMFSEDFPAPEDSETLKTGIAQIQTLQKNAKQSCPDYPNVEVQHKISFLETILPVSDKDMKLAWINFEAQGKNETVFLEKNSFDGFNSFASPTLIGGAFLEPRRLWVVGKFGITKPQPANNSFVFNF